MNELSKIDPTSGLSLNDAGLIKLAILAVGGQGGGVLTNWVLALAEQNGYRVQTTSVPGVAQRTGATIYYVEMLPDTGTEPVLALMPSPGDVDIVVAAELMEAGRAVTRGLVSPDRTVMVASSHRMFAVSEKIVPGDGVAESSPVLRGVEKSCKRLVVHDLQAIAEQNHSHISASLFGALAGSGALPFSRENFEETIRLSGRGVEASLAAFATAYDLASGAATQPKANVAPKPEQMPAAKSQALMKQWDALTTQLNGIPEPVQDIARSGLAKTVDYQDFAYGQAYVDDLLAGIEADRANGGEAKHFAYSKALAKYLANAMCYDDVIRVADLKTRSNRIDRVRQDVNAKDETVVQITEYMHPRAEEIIGMMPAKLGRCVEARPSLVRFVERRFSKGRHVRTDRLGSFLMLYLLGGMRKRRRGTLRHQIETAHRNTWATTAQMYLSQNYELATEALIARRLIKGYSDTHARGLSKYDRVLEGIELVSGRDDAADWARRLIAAALADVKKDELDGVIKTIRSFV